jgi:hypothetical protein
LKKKTIATKDTTKRNLTTISEKINQPEIAGALNKNTAETVSSRYIEFPAENNFNGKPLTQQLEIKTKTFNKCPDTLRKIAENNYRNYSPFFPVSIADNFEKGISTVHIHYPRLRFSFQIFEDEYSHCPYITKTISVEKDTNGELITKEEHK